MAKSNFGVHCANSFVCYGLPSLKATSDKTVCTFPIAGLVKFRVFYVLRSLSFTIRWDPSLLRYSYRKSKRIGFEKFGNTKCFV